MSLHRCVTEWALQHDEDFIHGRYSRGHAVTFEGGHVVPGTASPQVVGNKWAEKGAVDPEEMLVAAISTCHMLTFLHVARLKGFVVVHYRDAAEGLMAPNAQGRQAITRVTLKPEITYSGTGPSPAERDRLHHEAHEQCFIANSVTTEVVVEDAG